MFKVVSKCDVLLVVLLFLCHRIALQRQGLLRGGGGCPRREQLLRGCTCAAVPRGGMGTGGGQCMGVRPETAAGGAGAEPLLPQGENSYWFASASLSHPPARGCKTVVSF